MLKNLDKLKGSEILLYSPIEVLYNMLLEIEAYFVLVGRLTYPYPVYAKLSSSLDRIEEIYPFMIGKTKEESLHLFLDGKSVKMKDIDAKTPYYFSYSFDTGADNEDYIDIDGTLFKIRDKSEAITEYRYLKKRDDFASVEDDAVRKLLYTSNADYACLYLDPETEKTKKFFAGYSADTKKWKQLRSRFDFWPETYSFLQGI